LNKPNPIILSNYDLAYLDIGFGNKEGGTYLVFENWKNLYDKLDTYVEGVNIIGGEACMWD
jgi:hypothetical protein